MIQLNLLGKTKYKDNSVLDKFKKERENLMNPHKKVDMREILRKARLASQKNKSTISINHLSPNRNLRHH